VPFILTPVAYLTSSRRSYFLFTKTTIQRIAAASAYLLLFNP